MSELSLIDPTWELIDPNPNIWSLFADFDKRFFNGTLTSSFVELMWSSNRMTSTAGLCAWNPRTNYASIKLSQPLLQLRSRADLVETLLHEMIHAYLFVTREDDNHESHGPKFHMHMFRINKLARTNITVYHTFHDEVRSYQQHVWKCDGPCALRPPYYGYVRRANNRKPGSYDYWWSQHQSNCGGSFIKISEPEKVVKPKQNGKSKQVNGEVKNNKRIYDFFKTASPIKNPTKNSPLNHTIETKSTPLKSSPTVKHADIRNFISPVKSPKSPETYFPGKGHRLGSSSELDKPVKKLKLEEVEVGEVSSSQDNSLPAFHNFGGFTVQPILAMQSVNFLQNNKTTTQNCELPDLLSQILNKSTSSTESSKENRAESSLGQKQNHSTTSAVTLSDDEDFTYDLPDFEIDDSIIIENVVGNKNEQETAKTLAVDLNQPSTSKVQEPIHNLDEDEDEDGFTYDLPNFIPFCGPGHRLGSSVTNEVPSRQSKTSINVIQPKSNPSQKTQVINLI